MPSGFLPADIGKDTFFFNATLVENIISSKICKKRDFLQKYVKKGMIYVYF